MTWKNFKNWLEKNIITNEGLVVKIRPEKQSKYSKLSAWTLTDFCDSLEATLDKNTSFHLFPNFTENKSFEELFNSAHCYFGKRTNQEKTNENDYFLLEKLFYEWKQPQQETENSSESNNQAKKEVSWKEFNRWLQKEVIFVDDLQVKIRDEKQNEYGKISVITLTNFCDSLEATLDKNNSYHLFPEFDNNKSFEEIFSPLSCRFGKKTNQERIKEVDYALLETLFNEWKSMKENNNKLDLGRFALTYQNVFYASHYFNQMNEQLPEIETDENSSKEEINAVNKYKIIIQIYKSHLSSLNGVLQRLNSMIKSLTDAASSDRNVSLLVGGMLEPLTEIEDINKAVNKYMIGISEKFGGKSVELEGAEKLEFLIQEFQTFAEMITEMEKEGHSIANEFLSTLNSGNMNCFFNKNHFGGLVEDAFLVRNSFYRLKVSENNRRLESTSQINELKKLLGDSKKEIVGYKIKIQENKLEKLTQHLKVSREKVRDLRKFYQKLVRTQAQENFDYSIVALMEEKIEKIKDELLSDGWLTWKVSLEDVQKLCSKCEKLAKLKVEQDNLYKERFEARQEIILYDKK
ncbi:MAG: hypothetical protein I3273_04620 [Candidatus Moeniiplasma glomeromycotorum]|nr:hypothetical protein [Candidatus Moeniiplasma glomeromycotorum]MCE8169379.1 hypothetical protein [Candidatus Moeniiplasma glomeromycotorum]